VLPGTHSKWVRTQGTVLQSFTTFMTGEVYALLVHESILGALAEAPMEPAWDAFDEGVEVACGPAGAGGVLNTVFSARARVLTGSLPAAHVHDYLSGLMIGGELRAVRHSWLEGDRRATLLCVGDSALSQRYSRAARHAGWHDSRVVSEAAPAGLWRTAVAAGLLPASGETTSRQGASE
jgi:2-dehydro-3-deoxygalactonokinase